MLCTPSALAQTTAGDEDKRPLPEWGETFNDFLELDLFDIAVWRLSSSLLIVVAGIALRRFLLEKLLVPVRALSKRTETELDDQVIDALEHPAGWLINLVAVYFALLVLNLPKSLMEVASLVLQTIGTVMVAWAGYKLIDVGMLALRGFADRTESELDDQIVPILRRVVRVALFALVVVLIVQQWGYDVTSLIAGLGIGGLAFALAAKETLSNWFGSLMIFTDRPFRIGDRIRLDFDSGVVEEVGLRSTRIRTREDSLISVPNAKVATTWIDNLSERRKRWIRMTVGLVYAATPEQIEEVVEKIRAFLEEDDEIENDTVIVEFSDFGSSSLDVHVECYALVRGRADYYASRHRVGLRVMRIVREAGLSFAFPSQSLYVETPVEVRSAS